MLPSPPNVAQEAAVRPLAALHGREEPFFGGKACGLARLIGAGARVPDGFAVAATLDPPELWPDEVRQAVRRHAEGLLSAGPVVVRSSAPGEDGTQRSFAGLYETVLGVADETALLGAAARCIRSGASERVLAYAGTTAPRPVGLVIQRQVPARAAGVCFTVDPAGRDGAVVLEAVAGTGDALVSGRAQPEAWRVYRSGRGDWEARRQASSPGTVLTVAEAALVAEEGRALADRFGHPLDLEWAFDAAGALFWLQARPVTAASAPKGYDIERAFTLVDDGPVTVWANWNVREVMPEPFTPLNWSLWREVVLPVVMEDALGMRRRSARFPHEFAVDLVHGRVYWNMNALLGGPIGWLLLGTALGHLDERAAAVTGELRASRVLTPRRVPGSRIGAHLRLLGTVLRSATHVGGALRPRHALRALEEAGRRIASRPPVEEATDDGLLSEMALLGAPECLALRRGMQMLPAAFGFFAAAARIFRPFPRARRLLTSGIPDNPTTQISLEVDALVEAARPLSSLFREPLSTPQLLERLRATEAGRAWLAALAGVLSRCGQRCANEFDIGTPRWTEDPTFVVDLVRAGLSAAPGLRATDRLAQMAREREDAITAAAAQAAWWRRPLLRAAARRVAAYMPLREAPKHHTMFVFLRMRQAALEAGRRLVARSHLAAAEDVLFLERAEVQAALCGAPVGDLRARVEERRARHERHRAEKPPHFVRSDGVPVTEPDPEPGADGGWRGVGVSGGRVEGPVRLLRTPDPRAMSDGDVIVMEFADPGWTPLFPRAAAVVMEVGGAMCHAAVVARELGIPAVFGVAGATQVLRDGQRVVVDGETGVVRAAG